MKDADIIVIGAGAAGLSVASGAAQMGARAVLIEGGEMGGDCLNHGCVPSKALIAAAAAAQGMRDAGRFGVRTVEPEVDFAAVMDHVADVIAGIAPHDSQERFEGLGVRVIRGHARFVGRDAVEVNGERLTARRIVVAAGSRPFVPPVPGLDGVEYLTNETVFALRERPAHLLILGGGPIGVELAQAFCRLGSQVTLVQRGTILTREDPEAVEVVREALTREGVTLREGAEVKAAGEDDGRTWLRIGEERIAGSHLLVATGREAAVAGLGLEAAGITGDGKGIAVDRRLRTANRHVFAIGDIVAEAPRFTHVAGYHAGIVIRQAMLGLPAKADHSRIPRVTYAAPELAHIGLTEAEAREAHGAVQVIREDMSGIDRARAERTTEGWIKLVLHRGRPVGVTIVGAQAGELIAPWVQAMAAGTRLSTLSGLVIPYPTLSDLGKRAAGAYFSMKLFGNPWVERVVRLIQRVVP
ncbi:dihydrolipoyl dehydrogenase family protein [Pseudooceanicola sp.]|uniref:dihydrolipoyl dehydrogenase family protein n=1 Tax=Pseudooceanicola sp. TaxID=1914328 RepID=UPI0035C73549